MTRGYGGFSYDSPNSTFHKEDLDHAFLSEPRYLERPVSAADSSGQASSRPTQDSIWSQRSQSAAPSVRPPPGLSPNAPTFLQRSISAPHNYAEGTALRPNAKTLMDLIQEDYSSDDLPGMKSSVSSSPMYAENYAKQAWQEGEGTGIPAGEYPGEYRNVYQQRPQQQQHQQQQPITMHLSQPQMVVQQSHMIQQQPAQYQAQQPQIYYQQAPPPVERLQTQVLPNGQTVYINAAPVPQYGFTALPYQPQERFVPVMPVSTAQQPQNGYYDNENNYGRDRKNSRGRRNNVRSPKHTASQCALLDEFRQSKNRDWTVFRIQGSIVDFCQDQNGSRFIQQRLEMADPTEQDVVMREILPSIRSLRNDVFGNYVVQKLLDFGTDKIKEEIRLTMEGEMLPMSLQMYGCRVVQKALEALPDDNLTRLLEEFHNNVLSCIHDQNGNHVIQKCIEVMNLRAKKADRERANILRGQIEFILKDVLRNASSLSCHPYGCRVLQRILEHCEEKKTTLILDEILKSHRQLLDDQYGNYVIQHVLQFGREKDRDSILAIVVDLGLLGLSRQKFASNVVEKLLKHGNEKQRKAIVREMLKTTNDSTGPQSSGANNGTVVLFMVRDAYANYVVQTTLDVVPESEERRFLLDELNAHSEELRNYTFAKHIVAKLASLNQTNG